MIRALIPCCLLLAVSATPAAAWYVTAAGGKSDVGLDEQGTSWTVGAGETWPAASGPFDVSAELAYAQRAGSQPMIFTSPTRGALLDEAKVRLHMLRPAFFGGMTLPTGTVTPRLYVGFSVDVKLAESWDKPDGETNRVYGYEDIDAEFHAGLSVGTRRIRLDLRYNRGLLDQLIDRDADRAGSWEKAEGDLDGIKVPVDGARVSSWQFGVAVGF